jgi:hypothetical protein
MEFGIIDRGGGIWDGLGAFDLGTTVDEGFEIGIGFVGAGGGKVASGEEAKMEVHWE